MNTIHKQVAIHHGERSAEVDEELAPLIVELWKADCETFMSCRKHTTGKVWLAFVDGGSAERFLNVVAIHDKRAGSLWRRMNNWYFGQFESVAGHLERDGLGGGDWEYHVTVSDDAYNEERRRWRKKDTPNFRFAVSVLFPRSDLAAVTERMRAFNSSQSSEAK